MKHLIFLALASAFVINGCGDSQTVRKNVTIDSVSSNIYPKESRSLAQDIADGRVPDYNSSAPLKDKFTAVINYVRSLDYKCQDSRGYSGPVGALEWNEQLATAAREHSLDMLTYNNFSHYGSGRSTDFTGLDLTPPRPSTFQDRIKQAGYQGDNFIEIIGKATSENGGISDDYWINIIDLWKNSKKGHCSFLYNRNVTKFGMAQAISDDKTKAFYTVNFAN